MQSSDTANSPAPIRRSGSNGNGFEEQTDPKLTYFGLAIGALFIAFGLLVTDVDPIVWRLSFCAGLGLILAAFGTRANAKYRGFTITGAGAITIIFFYTLQKSVPIPAVPIVKTGDGVIYGNWHENTSDIYLSAGRHTIYGSWQPGKKTKYLFRIREDEILGRYIDISITDVKDDILQIDRRHIDPHLQNKTLIEWWYDFKNRGVLATPADRNSPITDPIAGRQGAFYWPYSSPNKSLATAHWQMFVNDALAQDTANKEERRQLIEGLLSDNSHVRRNARVQLPALGVSIVRPLLDKLHETPTSYRARVGVTNVLLRLVRENPDYVAHVNAILTKADIDQLVSLVADDDKTVRIQATPLVIRLDDERALSPTLSVLRKSKNPLGKYNAAIIIKELFDDLPEAQKAEAIKDIQEEYVALGPQTQAVLEPILKEPKAITEGATGWVYVGLLTYDGRIEKHFVVEGRKGTVSPNPGDVLIAIGSVNVRAGPIEFDPDTGWTNKRITGIIKPKDKVKVLETKDIASGFIWIKFQRVL